MDIAAQLDYYYENVFNLIDSKSAIQAISAPTNRILNPVILKVINLVKCLQRMGTKAAFVWITSDVGIPGNDKADLLAVKEAKNRLAYKTSLQRFLGV